MTAQTSILRPGLYTGQSNGAHLWLDHDGQLLRGFYSTTHGRPDGDERFPIVGCVNGPLLSFSVAWRGYHSITSWNGRVYDGEDGLPHLRCLWTLARQYADKALTVPTDPYETFLTFSGFYYWRRELQPDEI